MNRRSLERFRELQLRRRTDDQQVVQAKGMMPLIDVLPGIGPLLRGVAPDLFGKMMKVVSDPHSLARRIVCREDDVLRESISSVHDESCPKSLPVALRYLFDSMVDPDELTAYTTRHDGRYRGYFRIARCNGTRIMSPHYEDLVIGSDELVERALDNDSVFCIHEDTLFSRVRGSGSKVNTEKLPITASLARMIIPMRETGIIDVRGKDLTFGLFSTMSRVVDFANYFSIVLAMRIMADMDPLTGLFLRRVFEKSLRDAAREFLKTGENTTLLLLDIDDFKRVNDRYGHTSGNLVLAGCGSTASWTFRKSDILSRLKKGDKKVNGETLAARIGGEEFAFLLPGTNTAEGIEAARRYLEVVRSTEMIGAEQQRINVTTSIGVASFEDVVRAIGFGANVGPIDHADKEGTLIRVIEHIADKALYAAKGSGKDRVCFPKITERGEIKFGARQ